MGKLKESYNKIKPTQKQIKKAKKKNTEINNMCNFLEKQWNNNIKFNCYSCLKEAYESELHGNKGYVTDEDLIQSSKGKLKHK